MKKNNKSQCQADQAELNPHQCLNPPPTAAAAAVYPISYSFFLITNSSELLEAFCYSVIAVFCFPNIYWICIRVVLLCNLFPSHLARMTILISQSSV